MITDINIYRTKSAVQVLHAAVLDGKIDFVRYLVGDLEVVIDEEEDGKTALHWAREKNIQQPDMLYGISLVCINCM